MIGSVKGKIKVVVRQFLNEKVQQTPLYGQGRVSLDLWCHAGLILSKTWVEQIEQWTLAQSTQFLWPLTALSRDITNGNQPLLFFHTDPTNTTVWTTKSFIGSVVSCRVDFEQNLG
jgi:hypothetical protein